MLRILANHPTGLTLDEFLAQVLEYRNTLEAAFKTLANHDAIEQRSDSPWQITVELLHIWLQNYAPTAPDIDGLRWR